jgi:hypothetical protein
VPHLSPSTIARIWALLFALLLGHAFILAPAETLWRDYWLVKDGQPGMAVVTKEHWAGHNVVVYQYLVGRAVYTGEDRRSLQNPKYAHVMPGEKSIVYYSSSHPWLSAIDLPQHVVIAGLPVVLLAWLIEAGLVVTLINPESPWAFQLNGRRQSFFGKEIGGRRDVDAIRTADERASGSAQPASQFDGWSFFKDKLWLVACAVLIVFAMAAIEIAVNAVLVRK